MKHYMYITLAIFLFILCAWTLAGYLVERSVKTPSYTVLEKRDGYEVRMYESYITAQVNVTGSYDQALREGFTVLADYIFGNNTKQASLAMTAPVMEGTSQQLPMTAPVLVSESEKLAMTAPVLEESTQSERTISFVMPFDYTLETLPQPRNPRVEIVPQEARKVAALRFSWFRSSDRVVTKKQELQALLERDGTVVVGQPAYAGYSAPFTPPWLMRNEILIEIE